MNPDLFILRRSKQPTWEDLLDRESKQKDYRRDKRENLIPSLSKKHNDTYKQDNKNKKIVDLQKEFEQLKSKIKHVENKNQKMLSQLRTYNPDDEPIQDRTSPLPRRDISRTKISKQLPHKNNKRHESNSSISHLFPEKSSQILTSPTEYQRTYKNEFKHIVDATLSLKKKQEGFQKLIVSKLRDLGDRIVQVQQLSKICNDFMGLKEHSMIQEKESHDLYSMKSKQLQLIMSQLERDNKKLKQQNQDLTTEMEDQKTKFQTQKYNYQKEIQEIRLSTMKKVSESQSKYHKLIIKHEEEIQQIKKDYSQGFLDNSKVWRSNNQKLSKENQFEMLQLDCDNLGNLVKQLKSKLEYEKSRVLTISGEKDRAQFELQKLQLAFSVQDYSQELSNRKSQFEAMSNELKSLKRDKQQLEVQINGLRRQNKEYLLKINKKEEFRLQIEETYKSKLKEQSKLVNNIREQKKRFQLQLLKLKSLNKNLLSQKDKFGNQIVSEVKRILELENDAVIRTILENYASNPHVLALQVVRISTQRKITEQQLRKKLVQRGIVNDKDYSQGVKIQFFAVEHLWDQKNKIQKELDRVTQRLKQKQQQWQAQKQSLELSVSKHKKNNDSLRRNYEQDLRTKNQQILPLRDEESSKFNQMKTIIMKSESQKKQLQNKIKIMDIEIANIQQEKQSINKKKLKLQNEKEELRTSFEKQVKNKQQKMKKLDSQIRQMREEYTKKKTQLAMENKRLQYSVSELQIKLQKSTGDVQEKQILFNQKDDQLRRKNEDKSNLQSEVRQLTKKLSQSENQNGLKEQQLREKISESVQLHTSIKQLKSKIGQLEEQLQEKQASLRKQKSKTEEQRSNVQGTLSLIRENEEFLKKKLDQKTKDIEKAEESLKRYLEEKNTAQENYKNQVQKTISIENQLSQLKQKVKQMYDQLQEKNDRIKAAVEQQNIYTYNMEELRSVHSKKMKSLQSKLQESQQKYNQLLDQNMKIAKLQELSILNKQQSELKNSEIQQSIQRQRQQEVKLEQLQSSLQSKQQQLQIKLKQILYETTKLEAERSRLQCLRSKLQEQQSALNSRKQQIQQKQAKVVEQQEELEAQFAIKSKIQTVDLKSEDLLVVEENKGGDGIIDIQPFQEDVNKQFGLQQYDVSDNFQIGEVQSDPKNSPNAMVIQFFLRIKNQIQKVIFGQQLSVEIFEVLPVEIENQFQELIKLISQKVLDNQLSFIFIDQFNVDSMVGDSIMQEFPDLNNEVVHLKKRVSQQQRIIADLTSQKGHHEHTINQMTQEMEQIQEQNQARFIGQLSLLKQQLKEAKLKSDGLQIMTVATKKTLFNVLQILVSSQTGLQEDLAEALNYYNDVAKVSEKQKKQLASYFDQYATKSK